VPEPKPEAAQQRRRRRSRGITCEIAAVLREINALLAVPFIERGDRWEARASGVEARKASLIAEIDALAAARAVGRDPYTPPATREARTPGPEVVR